MDILAGIRARIREGGATIQGNQEMEAYYF